MCDIECLLFVLVTMEMAVAAEGLVAEVEWNAPEVEGRGDPENAAAGSALLLRGLVEGGAGHCAPLGQ